MTLQGIVMMEGTMVVWFHFLKNLHCRKVPKFGLLWKIRHWSIITFQIDEVFFSRKAIVHNRNAIVASQLFNSDFDWWQTQKCYRRTSWYIAFGLWLVNTRLDGWVTVTPICIGCTRNRSCWSPVSTTKLAVMFAEVCCRHFTNKTRAPLADAWPFAVDLKQILFADLDTYYNIIITKLYWQY